LAGYTGRKEKEGNERKDWEEEEEMLPMERKRRQKKKWTRR